MSCFSILEKFFLSKCYPPDGPDGQQPKPSKPEYLPSAPLEVNTFCPPAKKNQEEEDLFKEMEPTYVAPQRVSYTRLENQQSTSRFDIDEEEHGNWGEEDFGLD